jgi:hypothetical protein
MEQQLDKIEQKVDKILDRVGDHRERIAKIETTQRGFIAVITTIFTAFTAYLFSVLHVE